MILKSLKNRIYSDYFMPNRLDEYKAILEYALSEGYQITSTINYYHSKLKGDLNPTSKIIICRHDIDSDPSRARDFFEIEKELGVKSSFYFRLSTIEPKLMLEIEAYGSEASYHFEEISTYCKKNKIRSSKDVQNAMPKIQDEFQKNYFSIKERVKVPMLSVASHGDFVNRYLQVINHQLLTPELRERCNIQVEAYDPIIKENCISVSDTGSPIFWSPEPIRAVIERKPPVINLLTHPRHWGAAPIINLKDDLLRIWEGTLYTL